MNDRGAKGHKNTGLGPDGKPHIFIAGEAIKQQGATAECSFVWIIAFVLKQNAEADLARVVGRARAGIPVRDVVTTHSVFEKVQGLDTRELEVAPLMPRGAFR